MLTVDISSLSPGIHRVERSPSAEAVDLDPATFDQIHVEAELQYHRNRILVTLHAEAIATLTCDRTLKQYEQPVSDTYALLFGPPEMVGQEGEEFEEVRPLDPTDNELDLTDVVRDTLLLALPQRRIAPDAPDAPVEETFGPPPEKVEDDSPADPRWEKLRELREDDDSDA